MQVRTPSEVVPASSVSGKGLFPLPYLEEVVFLEKGLVPEGPDIHLSWLRCC